MFFSQRKGLTPIRDVVQKDSFDKATQNALWDVISQEFILIVKKDSVAYSLRQDISNRIQSFLNTFYKKILEKPLDEVPNLYYSSKDVLGNKYIEIEDSNYNGIREFWFAETTEYYTQLDIIEILLNSVKNLIWGDSEDNFFLKIKIESFNNAFKEYNVGYRIAGTKIVDITNEEELQSIEKAQKKSSHIDKAINFLYKEKDFENSIKESVCALEEISRKITGKNSATLSHCIKEFEKNNIHLHEAFKGMLDKVYAYAGDESRIRHANKNSKSEVNFEEAKLILLLSSATVNYLDEVYNKIK